MLTDVFCTVQTNRRSNWETITHHFFVSTWGRRKTVDAAKICGMKWLSWNRNPANIRKWIGFITLWHLYSTCVLLTIIAWVAHRYGQLYLHCSLIYFWVPSSCFCIVISPLRGEIILFSGVCQSGRSEYPRRRRWWLHALTDDWFWCATDDDQQQHHRITAALAPQFFAFCIERSNITLTHLHVSNCRVRQLQFSGIFVALFCR